MIPKLDLSKLKRDDDQGSLPQLNEPEELSDDDFLDTEDIQVQNCTEEALDTFDI